jgi:hypothetical protein
VSIAKSSVTASVCTCAVGWLGVSSIVILAKISAKTSSKRPFLIFIRNKLDAFAVVSASKAGCAGEMFELDDDVEVAAARVGLLRVSPGSPGSSVMDANLGGGAGITPSLRCLAMISAFVSLTAGVGLFGCGGTAEFSIELAARLTHGILGYASAGVVKLRLPAGRGCTTCLRVGAALIGGGGGDFNAGAALLLMLRGGGGGGTTPTSISYMISPVMMW